MPRWLGQWFGRWLGQWFGGGVAAPPTEAPSEGIEVPGVLGPSTIDAALESPTLTGVRLPETVLMTGALLVATVGGSTGAAIVAAKLGDDAIDAGLGPAKPALDGTSAILEVKTKWIS